MDPKKFKTTLSLKTYKFKNIAQDLKHVAKANEY